MKELKEKLKKDAETLELDKKTGFPVDVLIMVAMKKAETDATYRQKLETEPFLETLLYMAEWFVKEIVESEMTGNSAYVSDEQTFQAMDKWILSGDDERMELIEVLKEVKHPKSKNNPFLDRNFFTKANLEKIVGWFKERPLMKMLIEKYYEEPPKVTKKETPKKPATKKSQKKNSAQISLDMFEQMMGNEKASAEEENTSQSEIEEEHTVQESVSPENDIRMQKEENDVEAPEIMEKSVSEEDSTQKDQTEEVKEEVNVEETPKPTDPVVKTEQIDLFSLFR